MGAEQSKSSKASGMRSPNHDKHNSADSNTPLTQHARELATLSPAQDRRRWTIAGTGFRPDHTDEDNLPPARSVRSTSGPAPATARNSLAIDEIEGHADVSRPPRPPRLRRLSELIDPAEVPIDAHIRSPSGNLLAPEQFLYHPDRPLSIRERQEEIREKVRAASRLGMVSTGQEDEQGKMEIRRWARWLCCT